MAQSSSLAFFLGKPLRWTLLLLLAAPSWSFIGISIVPSTVATRGMISGRSCSLRLRHGVAVSMSGPHKGDQDMQGGIDGGKLRKEEREEELRSKISKIQQLKMKGLRYNGTSKPVDYGLPVDAKDAKSESCAWCRFESGLVDVLSSLHCPINESPCFLSPSPWN